MEEITIIVLPSEVAERFRTQILDSAIFVGTVQGVGEKDFRVLRSRYMNGTSLVPSRGDCQEFMHKLQLNFENRFAAKVPSRSRQAGQQSQWRNSVISKLRMSPGFTVSVLTNNGEQFNDVGVYLVDASILTVEYPKGSNQEFYISWHVVKDLTIHE